MGQRHLTDICDIQYGYPFESANFSTSSEGAMPLIRIRDVKNGYTETYYKGDYPKEYIVYEGDYLIGMDGEFNIAPWKSDEALLNQRVCKVSSKSADVSSDYVFRFLTRELKRIEDDTPFVTVKHLSAKRLSQIVLEVPPISEQEHIVAELDLLSDIIDKKKEQLKELDNLAQSIFYDMFGDPIANEKGWERMPLKGLCKKLFAGGDVPKDNFSKTLTDKYQIPIFSNGVGEKSLYGYTDYARVEEECITISGRGTIGYCMVHSKPFLPVVRLIVATPNPSKMSSLVLKFIVDSLHFTGTGGAIPQLTIPMIKDTLIIVPPLSLQVSFATKIEAIEKQKSAIQKSIEEAQTLFDSRMDYYFN